MHLSGGKARKMSTRMLPQSRPRECKSGLKKFTPDLDTEIISEFVQLEFVKVWNQHFVCTHSEVGNF